MRINYIKKGVWQLGGKKRKQKGGFRGAIASAVVSTVVGIVANTIFGSGLKKLRIRGRRR